MASPLFSLLCLFALLFVLTLSSSSTATKPNPTSTSTSTSTSTTISLSPSTKTPFSNPWQRLNHLVSSSISRARHLKRPHNSSLTKTPLFPRSFGGYSISLSFGTPPQTLSFVMDTGSSLVWFPCTSRYVCTKCNFPNINSSNIKAFIPKLSSSAKILGCRNPKCGLILDPDVQSRCQDCDQKSGNCTEICPPYLIQYGSGTTSGILLSETLDFPEKSVNDFVVGCSIVSSRQPSGIAGFGRGPSSLPSQMGLKKFSYCLVSHRFDDAPVSSDLVLVSGSDSGDDKTASLSHTPFIKNNLTSNSAFQEYYYVGLRKITVGGEHIKIPYSFLVPGSDGNGGTIVDSGTTFTFMERAAYELVAAEFGKQMKNYSRATNVEKQSGFRPCFGLSAGKSVLFPELVFHFKGGGKMELPLADYFSLVADSVVCMTIVTDNEIGPGTPVGPSIILGNYQQQNFYLEYDLKNERLGFRKQICK